MVQLIAFRVVQGIGAAALISTNLAPVAATLPSDAQQALSELEVSGAIGESVAQGTTSPGADLVERVRASGAPAATVEALQGASDAIGVAVKTSFAQSIATIYAISVVLALANLLLTLFFLPEIPLRTTNRPDSATISE